MTGIAEAVDSVFNSMGNAESKLIEINCLMLKALEILNVPATSKTATLEAIKSYVRAESKLFVATGGVVGKYVIFRGGGVRNSSPATLEKYNAIKTKKTADVVVL
jgi:hypothetical protein